MHVIIRSLSFEVAWNVNKFCVYVLVSSFCILSNIADTVNKPKKNDKGCILLHKYCLIKWLTKKRGGQKTPKKVLVIYRLPQKPTLAYYSILFSPLHFIQGLGWHGKITSFLLHYIVPHNCKDPKSINFPPPLLCLQYSITEQHTF